MSLLCPSTGYAVIAHSSWIFKDEYLMSIDVNTSVERVRSIEYLKVNACSKR